MYNIDKKYGVPVEEISCPGCGQNMGIIIQRSVKYVQSAVNVADVKSLI